MAYGLNDRVREQVSAFAGGTGTVTLPVSAVSGFQTFLSGWGASGTGEYCLVIGAQWETGFGTLNAGGTTLTRTTTYNGSSGAGVAVNFSAGTMDCFGDIPAELAQHLNMREITVASATTCDIGAVAGSNIIVSGTTTITGFGTKANRRRYVRFSGALTLTHNGTSLILPGAANIITIAGDIGTFASDASGNWRCHHYRRGSGGAGLEINKVVVQQFLATGTYTPSAGMVFAIIDCQAGGGGGGGVAGGTGFTLAAAGGAAGGRSIKRVTASDIGASKAVTVGAAGAGGTSGGNSGSAGGDTSVGTLCIAKGGGGGAPTTTGSAGAPSSGGVAGTGDDAPPGMNGSGGFYYASSTILLLNYAAGQGANSTLGGGGLAVAGNGNSVAGNAASGFGAGGGGAASQNSATNAAGGAGTIGRVFITEFCSQ